MREQKNLIIPYKGMDRDSHPSRLDESTYSFAKNVSIEDSSGNGLPVIQNETSNLLCNDFMFYDARSKEPITEYSNDGFKIVGYKYNPLLDRVYYFLTNGKSSLIGYSVVEYGTFENEDVIFKCGCNTEAELATPLENINQKPHCKFYVLLDDSCKINGVKSNGCLNFSLNYPIKESNVVFKNEQCGLRMYWTDGFNPPRYLDLDVVEKPIEENPYFYNFLKGCDDKPKSGGCLDCDKLKLIPDYTVPCMTPKQITLGGNLKMGSYEFLIAYCDEMGNEMSDYHSHTNAVNIFDYVNVPTEQTDIDRNTNYAIELKIDNLDEDFKYYKVVVIERTSVDGAQSSFVEGIHNISEHTVIYGTNQNKERIDLNRIFVRRFRVSTVESLSDANGYLFLGGLKHKRTMNLQPVVNFMGSYMNWVSYLAKEDFYKEGINAATTRGYMRDEVYPFAITFILKDGSRTNDFILSSRNIDISNDVNFKDGEKENLSSLSDTLIPCSSVSRTARWQFFNTAKVLSNDFDISDKDIESGQYDTKDSEVVFYEKHFKHDSNVKNNLQLKVGGDFVIGGDLTDYIKNNLKKYQKGGIYYNESIDSLFDSTKVVGAGEHTFKKGCENKGIKSQEIYLQNIENPHLENIVYNEQVNLTSPDYVDLSFPEGMRVDDSSKYGKLKIDGEFPYTLNTRQDSEKGLSCENAFDIPNNDTLDESKLTSLSRSIKTSNGDLSKVLDTNYTFASTEKNKTFLGTYFVSSDNLELVSSNNVDSDKKFNIYKSYEKWVFLMSEEWFTEHLSKNALFLKLSDATKFPYLQLNFKSKKIAQLLNDEKINQVDVDRDLGNSRSRKIRVSAFKGCSKTPVSVKFYSTDNDLLLNIVEEFGDGVTDLVIESPISKITQQVIEFDRFVKVENTLPTDVVLDEKYRVYKKTDSGFVYPNFGDKVFIKKDGVNHTLVNVDVSTDWVFNKPQNVVSDLQISFDVIELTKFKNSVKGGDVYLTTSTDWSFTVYQKSKSVDYYSYSVDEIKVGKKYVYNVSCKVPKAKNCDKSVYARGEFAYWQSEEEYPCNDELFNSYKYAKDKKVNSSRLREIFENRGVSSDDAMTIFRNNYGIGENNICVEEKSKFVNQKIRHFKFPDNYISPFVGSGGNIYPLGVKLDKKIVDSFLDLAVDFGLITQEQRDDIFSFELKRGDRRLDKSILSKGLITDVWKYNEVSNRSKDSEYYFSNYLLNVQKRNPFLLKGVSSENLSYNSDRTRYTFVSPELFMGEKLQPTEISIEGVQSGNTHESVYYTEQHPKWVILSKKGFDVADKHAAREVFAENLIKISSYLIEAVKASGGGFDEIKFQHEVQLSGQTNGTDKTEAKTEDKKDTTGSTNTEKAKANVAKSAFSALGIVPGVPGNDSSGGTRKWAYYASLVQVGFIASQLIIRWSDRRAELRNKWLDIIKAKGAGFNFCSTISGVSDYNSFSTDSVDSSSKWRPLVKQGLLKEGMYNIREKRGNKDKMIRFNNIDRERLLYLSFADKGALKYTQAFEQLNSDYNFIREDRNIISNDGLQFENKIGNFYTSLKLWKPSQYGEIQDIRWIDIGRDCDNDGVYWGGDIFISKFAYRKKFNYFLVSSMLQGDFNTPFKYSNYYNIKNAKYVVDYETETERLGWSNITSRISNYKLFGRKEDGNYVVGGRFFHYHYNIPYFFVESEINCWNRYKGREIWEDFYPNFSDINKFTQESIVSIRREEKFLYHNVYSVAGVSLGGVFLPLNYDRVTYDCMNDSPNGVMYSLQDTGEKEKVDPWLIYRNFDYYNFPANYGKLITLKGLESVQVLGLFENTAVLFNAIDELKDRITPESSELGTGGIFARRPISFHTTDLGYGGTQHSASVSCEFGHFWVDCRRGQVLMVNPNGQGLDEITEGLRNWFKEHLPFKILKGGIKGLDDLSLDNVYKDIGISLGYDSRFKRIFLTKLDYEVRPEWRNKISFEALETMENTQNRLSFLKTNYVFYIDDNGVKKEISLQDKKYFIPCPFTVAYSPLTKSWISYYDFTPAFYISKNNYFETGGNNINGKMSTWSHLLTNKSYGVFYGKKYPWKFEVATKLNWGNNILSSVEFWLDSLRYRNAYDYSFNDKLSLDKAFVYNQKSSSGCLRLIPKEKNNLYQYTQYPKVTSEGTEILVAKDEGRWSFNDFYDRLRKENSNIPLWNYDINAIDKFQNISALDYKTRWNDRLRGDWFFLRFEGGSDTRYKQIFKWLVPNREIVL